VSQDLGRIGRGYSEQRARSSDKYATSIIKELKAYRGVARTLATMDKLNPDFVKGAISQMPIKDRYAAMTKTSLEGVKEILQAV
jgi:hypothetical protein